MFNSLKLMLVKKLLGLQNAATTRFGLIKKYSELGGKFYIENLDSMNFSTDEYIMKIDEIKELKEKIEELEIKCSIKWNDSPKSYPESNKPVIWISKTFSKERGKIEAGRYDRYYDCFCGSASLFVNRRDTVKWIYVEDLLKW